MTQDWTEFQRLAAVGGAAALFLLSTGLSVALVAVAALSRVALHRIAAEDPARLTFLDRVREPLSTHRTAAQLGRQLGLLGGTLCVVIAAHLSGWIYADAFGVALAALVAVLVSDLLIARCAALWRPRGAIRHTAFLVRLTHAMLFPVVGPVHALLARIDRSQTDDPRENDQDEEVEAFIEVGEREGILEADEGKMMRGIVDLDETVVRKIMTPRLDIVAVQADTTVEQARSVFIESGHSRIPVYGESIDEILGILHVRDLLKATGEGIAQAPISRYQREATFVAEGRSAAELLAEMRLKSHVAIVVDGYGGTAGLVTLEDLVEEIVGEIRDEHEEEESLAREEDDGSWTISASAHVEMLEELFGVELGERDFDTVGGLVVSELRRVPVQGDTLAFQSLEIEVLHVQRQRILKVRIHPLRPPDVNRAGL